MNGKSKADAANPDIGTVALSPNAIRDYKLSVATQLDNFVPKMSVSGRKKPVLPRCHPRGGGDIEFNHLKSR